LHNNIYWSTSSSLLIIFVNIFPLADFDLTSSLRSRFPFLSQITISAQQRTTYSCICCQLFISTCSFAVFSVTCVEKGILRLHHGIGSEPLRCSVLERLARSAAFLLHHYSSRLYSCSACPAVFIHSFWVDRSFHFNLYHSFWVARSSIHFCMTFLIWCDSFIYSCIDWLIDWVIDCCASRCGEIEDLVDGVTRGEEITCSARVYRMCCMPWLLDWLIRCGSLTSLDSIIHTTFIVFHSFYLLSSNKLTSII
jgi:hypothetical protein